MRRKMRVTGYKKFSAIKCECQEMTLGFTEEQKALLIADSFLQNMYLYSILLHCILRCLTTWQVYWLFLCVCVNLRQDGVISEK